MFGTGFATRINSFASGAATYWPDQTGKPSLAQMVGRAASVSGLSELGLNCPDHVSPAPEDVGMMVRDCGLQMSGLAMRYYTNPAFKRGAFTNPDPAVRRAAIDLTKRGIDAMGAPMMTLWLGQDGWVYAFQADYSALVEVAAHDPDCLISLEYKPNEPRAYSVFPMRPRPFWPLQRWGVPIWASRLILPIPCMRMNNPPLPVRWFSASRAGWVCI